jgi:hypothetical protein
MSDELYGRYFVDREQYERDMSRRCRDERVSAVHSEMADRYEALALVFGAKRPPRPGSY